MKLLKAKCKYCGKEIASLYKNQLEQNLEAHEKSCKKKQEEKENETNKEKGK